MGAIIILNLIFWILSILFVMWFITSVQDILRIQRKKLQIFEEMLASQKETNRILRLFASNQRETEY
jgi:preprotein translocase subunit YajC